MDIISTHYIPATSLQVGMTIADTMSCITQIVPLRSNTLQVHTVAGVVNLKPSDMVEVVEDIPGAAYTPGTHNPTYKLRKP